MAIRVELELIDGTFTTRMLHAGETVDRFNQALARAHPQVAAMAGQGDLLFRSFTRADGATNGILSTLRDFSIVAGAVTLAVAQLQQVTIKYVGSIVQVNAEFERMTRLLAGMSTAADPMADATNQMAQFRQLAKEMPFAMETIMGGAVKLKAVGMDPLDGSLRSVADAVAAFGGTDESFNRAILAMTQMSGKGVIQMEELRQQLGEAIPRATELMARSMGVSYAELMSQIATGTVEANSALKSMLLEFDRTFGGAAIRMMTTYSGQVELLKTNLQNLALAVGGDINSNNSFFGELKNQLRDLNFFLEGPQAKEFAQAIGEGLKTTIVYIRQAIDFIVQFREEILSAGKALAIAFGGMLVFRSFQSLGNVLSALGTQLQGLGVSWALMTQRIAAADRAFAAIPAGAGLAQTALGSMSYAATLTGRTLQMLFVTMSTFSAAIPFVGLAIWGLAEYFDWFGKSTAEALAELDKLDKKSRELEVKKKVEPLLDKKRGELEGLRNLANAEQDQYGTVSPMLKDEIAGLESEIKQLESRLKSAAAEARSEDIRAAANDARARMADELAKIKSVYDIQRQEIQKTADAEIAAGKDSIEVNTERKAKLMASNKEQYAAERKLLEGLYEAEKAFIASSKDPRAIEESKVRQALYAEELNRLNEMNAAFDEMGMAVKNVAGGDNLVRQIEKGNTALSNLKEQAAGLRSQIRGGSSAMGELIAKIENGNFGNIRDMGVQKLIKDLIEAQNEVDNLKEALDYITGAQKLYDDTMGGINDKIFELQTEGMNDAEKYVAQQQRLAQTVSPGGRLGLMMLNLKGTIDQTNTSLGGLVTGFTERLFGTDTVNQGQTVVGILDQMLQRVMGITGAINGLQFNASGGMGAGMSFTGPRLSGPSIEQAVKNGMLSLIGAAEGTDKGRGYNETLAYGAFTGGPVDLVNMTLREVRALQRQMLANPANTWNSSAVGRYQIVGKTLEGLIAKLNLSLDQKFTPDLQDRLARELLAEAGRNPGRLRSTWEGLRRVDDASIYAAYDNGTMGATGMPDVVRDGAGKILTLKQQVENIMKGLQEQGALTITAEKNKYIKQLEDITDKAKGATEAEVELRRRIREGGLNQLDKDPDSPRYKELFDILKKVDEAEKGYQDTKSKRKEVTDALEQNEKDLLEAERQLKVEQTRDTNPYAEQQAGLEALKQKYDELIAKAKEVYGVDSTQYKTLLDQKERALAAQQQRDFSSTMSVLREKRNAEEEANLTDIQRSNRTIDQKIADLREYLANFKGTEAERLAVAQQVNATIAALEQQRQAASSNAFTDQMKQWTDLSGNMAQYMSGVANTLADALTNMIMGEKVDWQQIMKSMIKDLVNMGIKYLMGSLMGGKGQMAGMMPGGGKMGMMGGKGKMMGGKGAGVMHTGGIVGRMSAVRNVSPLAFAGAPRFHSGGMIRGLGIGPDEVPIIARKGEGVFTPEQMQAMASGGGGNRSMAVNTNVTVNAQGGDARQNGDLAKQVAKEVENSVRGIVYKEMRAQMRPGNMMNR